MEKGARREVRHEVDGLAVIDTGPSEARPRVIVVHGGMDRSSSFGRMIRHLPHVAVRRYDRRGYGRSADGGVTDLDGHIDDLLAVADGDRAVVFGHSIGGTIALVAALRHPDRFAAVGTYESPLGALLGDRRSEARDLPADPGDAAEAFMVQMAGERIWRRLPAATRVARRAEGPALLADLAILDRPLESVGELGIPALIGAGGDRRRQEAAETSARALGAEVLLVPGADHGIHLADPAAAAALVERILALALP